MKRSCIAVLLLNLTVLTGGCAADPAEGWSTTTTWPDSVRTVAVPAVMNTTYHREIGPELTKASIEAIERRTPYKVTDELRADSVLTVEIKDLKLTSLSQSALTKLDQEVLVQLTIDWRWENLNDTRLLAGSEGFSGSGVFIPSQPSGEPIEVGQRQVASRLAEDLVDRMRGAW